ncbi:hypothetical protein TNCT_211861 [Trichonephila clavata]|uniref:Uncharacterized protein n=1 Tax=Trichonephila clavata TaxID=2740835 RepID=A0A8X6HQU2_TRICU|nr:hypothetical protein TNCT_211861 [Trichonephila clavata]
MAYDKDSDSETWTTFFWNMENYTFVCGENLGFIDSPTFEANSIEDFSWNICLHSNGYIEENFVYLEGNSLSGWGDFAVEYDVAILAEDGSVLKISGRKRRIVWKGTIVSYLTNHQKIYR